MLNATRLGWPSAPPASVVPAQEKLVKVSVVPMLFPAVPPVVAVTVTVWQGVGLQPLVNAAVASTLVFELTEVAKFVASAMGLKEIAKCVGSTVGSAPPAKLGPVHAKSSKPSESAMLFPASPGSVAKTVTVLPLAVE